MMVSPKAAQIVCQMPGESSSLMAKSPLTTMMRMMRRFA
jgi:hypothetical protein